ncbi:MAG: type II toxin-antitoxin system ParD family antitoxin [Cohaesibacter sp.]|nr:type II toxin-antitoxin system ParD family antitoxin [Cohaesibacter sp.]
MALVKKTINVTDQQEAWIKAQIESGNYGNDSELFRDLIRKEQSRANELETIRAALIAGENSGLSSRTPEEIKQAVIKKMTENGQISTN